MKYLFETHAHTSEISPCAFIKAENVVKAYRDSGYSGLILTDHVGAWSFDKLSGSWKEKADKLIRTYETAANIGEKIGIKVLFGMEIALKSPLRDYLAYGFDNKILYDNENIYDMSVAEFYKLANREGFLLASAHPFRYERPYLDTEFIHAAEVFNGNSQHENRNDMTLKWAEQNNLIKISGSDFHEHEDISAGVFLPICPNTIEEFTALIFSGNYKNHPSIK